MHEGESPQEYNARVRSYLGKRVEVVLHEGSPGGEDAVITRGTLLGFGTGGDIEIQEDDMFVHWCWPALSIRLI